MKLLLPFVLILSCTQCQGNRMKCKDPSEEHLRQKLLRHYPAYPFDIMQDSIIDMKKKKCPTSINGTSELKQDRSISPWSFRINEDVNRYPQKIPEAYCLCRGCVTSKESSMVSEPFYKLVPVMHKTSKCKKGRFVYKVQYIKIAHFCVCRFH
ncbi:interleukin-17D-like isoform X2 [Pseudophryne corroboree]